MTTKKAVKKVPPLVGKHFGSVKKARELILGRASEIVEGYLVTIKQAAAAGDFETAVKGYQHLIDHMPADEDGNRMIEQGIDKKQVTIEQGANVPRVQIGIAIGGTGQRQLSEPVIDTIVIDDENSK